MAKRAPVTEAAVMLGDMYSKKLDGKVFVGVNDIRVLLKIGHNKAVEFLDGEKTINVYQLAQKLL